MTDLVEIKGLVERVNETLVPLRTDVDALKKRDVIDEDRLTKMADDVTAKMQAIMDAQAKEIAGLKAGTLGGKTGGKDEAEAKSRFDAFMRKEGEKGSLEIRAMATTDGPDGGFLVMPEFSATIMSRVFETSPLRLVANIEQTGGKSRTFLIDDDEGTADWSGEKVAATEDTPDVGEKEIVVHNVRAKMNATADILADAYVDLASWLTGKGSDKIARAENTAFVAGNGVAKPRGFTTYPAWAAAGVYERDKIERIKTGAAGAVTAEGFINLQYGLKEAYQPGAVFGMKRATYGAALKLKGSDQFYFGRAPEGRPGADHALGQAGRLHGRHACDGGQRSGRGVCGLLPRLHHPRPCRSSGAPRPVQRAPLHDLPPHEADWRRCDQLRRHQASERRRLRRASNVR
jgi:HK97 family phage major capsid protein